MYPCTNSKANRRDSNGNWDNSHLPFSNSSNHYKEHTTLCRGGLHLNLRIKQYCSLIFIRTSLLALGDKFQMLDAWCVNSKIKIGNLDGFNQRWWFKKLKVLFKKVNKVVKHRLVDDGEECLKTCVDEFRRSTGCCCFASLVFPFEPVVRVPCSSDTYRDSINGHCN